MKKSEKTAKTSKSSNQRNRLDALLEEAKRVGREIDKAVENKKEALDVLDGKINETINEVEQIFSDLDGIKKEAKEKIDGLTDN